MQNSCQQNLYQPSELNAAFCLCKAKKRKQKQKETEEIHSPSMQGNLSGSHIK